MTITPEHIRWAISHSCVLRDGDDGQSPLNTERQLRPIRAVSDGLTQDRVLDGICVQPISPGDSIQAEAIKGFQISDVLALGGGMEQVARTCGQCDANALAAPALAGCYGELPARSGDLFPGLPDLRQHTSDMMENVEQPGAWPLTHPRWYGLWMSPSLDATRLATLERLFTRVAANLAVVPQPLEHFLVALGLCLERQLVVRVELVPAGRLDGPAWLVDSHCQHCHAPQDEGMRRCPACRATGPPRPEQRRLRRGSRPYWHIERFLGTKGGAEFIRRYLRYKGLADVQITDSS